MTIYPHCALYALITINKHSLRFGWSHYQPTIRLELNIFRALTCPQGIPPISCYQSIVVSKIPSQTLNSDPSFCSSGGKFPNYSPSVTLPHVFLPLTPSCLPSHLPFQCPEVPEVWTSYPGAATFPKSLRTLSCPLSFPLPSSHPLW